MSYLATIAKLESVRKHPNADRLQIATCLGSTVIVGLDAKDGDIVVFFDSDGQLSHEYVFENSLYNKPELNKDKERKGLFDNKRRVRCQSLRGVKSEAYVALLDSLIFTGIDLSTLTVGTRFDTLNGIPIANKYVTPATLKAAKGNQPKQKTGLVAYLKDKFKEHVDTEQLKYANDTDLIGLVTVSVKVHGTSSRHAKLKAPVEQKQHPIFSGWNSIVDKIYFKLLAKYKSLTEDHRGFIKIKPKVKEDWVSVYGTRRVVKGQVTETYEDFRTKVHKKIDPFMNKGECWYLEIVGFEGGSTPIMNRVSTKELPKDLQKKFGETVTYKYGCLEGEHDCYVYRITVSNEDGDIYELPWSQVKNRCVKAGIKHVPEICQFLVTADNCAHVKSEIVKFVEDNHCDLIDQSHPLEGVCVRVDNLTNGKMTIYKQKGLIFRILEGIAKSDEMFVDEEESQG